MSAPECCQKINKKSFLITSLVVFVVMFITDFIIHGVLMKDAYQATASFWRPESEMKDYFQWMLLGQLIISICFTRLFAHGHQGKGVAEGVCFGFMFGGIFVGNNFILYSVTAYPMSLIWWWIGASIVQSVIIGAVAAKVYKPN